MSKDPEVQDLQRENHALQAQLTFAAKSERRASNILRNLLYSIDDAILFLDESDCVEFFTNSAERHFRVISSDIGRSVDSLWSLAFDRTLGEDLRAVRELRSTCRTAEVAHRDVHFRRTVSPRLSEHNTDTGTVVAYVDISDRKRVSDAVEGANYLNQYLSLSHPNPVCIVDSNLLVLSANEAMKALLPSISINGSGRHIDLSGQPSNVLDTLNRFFNDAAMELGGSLSCDLLFEWADGERHTARITTIEDPDRRWFVLQLQPGADEAADDTATPRGDAGPPAADRAISRSSNFSHSEFAEAVHQLGQPLQSLSLALSILAKEVQSQREKELVQKCEESVAAAAGGLVSLADIEAADSMPDELRDFPLSDVLGPFQLELSYHAAARSIRSRVMPSRRRVKSSPKQLHRLLRRIALNMISDGAERVLVGPRAERDGVAIDIFSIGSLGKAAPNAQAGARHQFDRAFARVASPPLDVADIAEQCGGRIEWRLLDSGSLRVRVILQAATDTGNDAPATVKRGAHPGINAVARSSPAPAFGTSNGGSRPSLSPHAAKRSVAVIDDDAALCRLLGQALAEHYAVSTFSTAPEFLERGRDPDNPWDCIVVDAMLPEMDGFELLRRLNADSQAVPSVMITGFGDVQMAVEAMKCGAAEFIEKPVNVETMLKVVARLTARAGEPAPARPKRPNEVDRTPAQRLVNGLTNRQREVMALVVEGHANKEIAARLALSQRTVENHRAQVMKRTRSRSVTDLVRLAMACEPPA